MAAADDNMIVLVALVLAVSVIEIVYYFKVMSRLYFRKAHTDIPVQKANLNGIIAMSVLGILVVAVGVYPDLITHFIETAANALMDKTEYINNVLPGITELVN